ncbi:MAG: hypothetical protein WBE34_20865 [Candidatus Nitrosopolaris sp.]
MKKADFEPTTLADDKTDSSDKRQGGIKKTEKKGKKQQGDKWPKNEAKQVTPPPRVLVISFHTRNTAWTTSQLVEVYCELGTKTRSIGIFLLSKSCLITRSIFCGNIIRITMILALLSM